MIFSCRYCKKEGFQEEELAPGYTNIKKRSGRCLPCKRKYEIQRELRKRVRRIETGVAVCLSCESLQTEVDNKQKARTECRFCGHFLLTKFKDLPTEIKRTYQ